MPRTMLVISSLAVLLLGACTGGGEFACADDQACVGVGPGARCEVSGWCSFEDEVCDSGHRYGDHAGDGLGGVCVGEDDATGGTSSGTPPSTTPATTLDGPLDTSPSTSDTSDDTGPPVQEGWWDCGWAERRGLVLDVPDTGEVLTDVPVLVVLDASRIDPSIMATDGRDLRFVAEDGTTVLSHQLEQWSAEGLSWAWVRVPELHAGTNVVTMYYGNPSAELLDGAPVWSSYTGVWHMGFEFADATATSAPGLGMATMAAGQVGPAQRFTPPNDGVEIMPGAAVGGLFAAGGTITAMIRPSGFGDGEQGLVVGRFESPNGDGGWVLAVDGSRQALRFARGVTVGRRTWYTPDGSLVLDAWHHVAVVYEDSERGDPTVYIDGVSQPVALQGTSNGGPEPDDVPPLYIGGVPFTDTFDGIIDEVRVAPLPRSAAWVTVELAALRDELASYGAPESSACE